MSLIGTIGQVGGVVQSISNLFGGGQNASQLSDCIGAAGKYGTATALAMYPQCAPYAAQMNVPIGTPNPRIPATSAVAPPVMMAPPVPQAMPGGAMTYPAPMQTLPVAYTGGVTPAMTLPSIASKLPQVATGVLAGATALTAASKKLLPVLNKSVALASGYIVTAGLVYTAAGQLVGRIRRRRRVNPLNYRAAKRAARRLCMVRDLCGQIDKAIPSRPARSRRKVYAFQRKRKTCR